MQKIVRVKFTVEEYVREQYHKRMPRPAQCPNCGRFHRLWAHAYYDRDTTDSVGEAITFWVRRFICTVCRVTVSCLPCFAQPYRFVNHTTLEAFVKAEYQRRPCAVPPVQLPHLQKAGSQQRFASVGTHGPPEQEDQPTCNKAAGTERPSPRRLQTLLSGKCTER